MANVIPSSDYIRAVEKSTGFVFPEKFKEQNRLSKLAYHLAQVEDIESFFIADLSTFNKWLEKLGQDVQYYVPFFVSPTKNPESEDVYCFQRLDHPDNGSDFEEVACISMPYRDAVQRWKTYEQFEDWVENFKRSN